MPNVYRLFFKSEKTASTFAKKYQDDPHTTQVVMRGVQYKQVDTGEVDADGLPIYESVEQEGFQVDVVSRTELKITSTRLVEPETPDSIYA